MFRDKCTSSYRDIPYGDGDRGCRHRGSTVLLIARARGLCIEVHTHRIGQRRNQLRGAGGRDQLPGTNSGGLRYLLPYFRGSVRPCISWVDPRWRTNHYPVMGEDRRYHSWSNGSPGIGLKILCGTNDVRSGRIWLVSENRGSPADCSGIDGSGITPRMFNMNKY